MNQLQSFYSLQNNTDERRYRGRKVTPKPVEFDLIGNWVSPRGLCMIYYAVSQCHADCNIIYHRGFDWKTFCMRLRHWVSCCGPLRTGRLLNVSSKPVLFVSSKWALITEPLSIKCLLNLILSVFPASWYVVSTNPYALTRSLLWLAA